MVAVSAGASVAVSVVEVKAAESVVVGVPAVVVVSRGGAVPPESLVGAVSCGVDAVSVVDEAESVSVAGAVMLEWKMVSTETVAADCGAAFVPQTPGVEAIAPPSLTFMQCGLPWGS